MYSRYYEWMIKQSLDFIKEVHPKCNIPNKFKLERPDITLQELEKLDEKFINNPEGDINGDTTNG